MSTPTGLTGLWAAADATLRADVAVTPELKARLMTRIRTLEQLGVGGSAKPPEELPDRTPDEAQPGRRVFHLWATRTVWSAAVVVVAVGLTLGRAPQGPPVAHAPASSGQLAFSFPPAPAIPAARAPAPAQGNTTTVTIAAMDANGNVVRGSTSTNFSVTASSSPTMKEAAIVNAPIAGSVGAAKEAEPGRKIVTNGEYGLRVDDAAAAVQRLQEMTLAAGGYVADASVDKASDGSWQGSMTLRIPADKAAGVAAQLVGVGQVEHQRQWTQDVTDQYTDMANRIAILQEHEQRLRELAAKAATFDDWNKLAQQINDTRVQVEDLTGKLKLLTNQVDYAIIRVSLVQPAPLAVRPETGASTLGGQATQAFTNSARTLWHLAQRLLLGLVALVPYLVVLVVPVGAGFWFWRRRRVRMQQ